MVPRREDPTATVALWRSRCGATAKSIRPPSRATRSFFRLPRDIRPDPHRFGPPCGRERRGRGGSMRTPGPRREPSRAYRSGGRPPRNSPSCPRGSGEAPARPSVGRPCRGCPGEGPERAEVTRSTPSPGGANGSIPDLPRNTPLCRTGPRGHRSRPFGNRRGRWRRGPARCRRREPIRGRSVPRRSGSGPPLPRTDALRATCRGAPLPSSLFFPPWRRSFPPPPPGNAAHDPPGVPPVPIFPQGNGLRHPFLSLLYY